MRAALPTQPSFPPPVPPVGWICVVQHEQVWRDNKSGVLFEVILVKCSTCDASVTLRPVDALRGDDDITVNASVLCGGNAWTRLPDDEGETTLWRT